MMTESVRAGPNFSVISCLCLWTARWSSFVNLYTIKRHRAEKVNLRISERARVRISKKLVKIKQTAGSGLRLDLSRKIILQPSKLLPE